MESQWEEEALIGNPWRECADRADSGETNPPNKSDDKRAISRVERDAPRGSCEGNKEGEKISRASQPTVGDPE